MPEDKCRVIVTVVGKEPLKEVKAGDRIIIQFDGSYSSIIASEDDRAIPSNWRACHQSEYEIPVPVAPEGHELTGKLARVGTPEAECVVCGDEVKHVDFSLAGHMLPYALDLRWQLKPLPPKPTPPKREEVLVHKNPDTEGYATARQAGYKFYTFDRSVFSWSGGEIYRASDRGWFAGFVVAPSGDIVEASK